MGLMVITSRIGAATAPFIVQMTRINSILPFAVMGVAAIIAAVGCWFLPETKGKPTREVLGDGELENNPQEGIKKWVIVWWANSFRLRNSRVFCIVY
jgi:OCT family organic cation transporter-like MFS transporter 4/5